MTLLSPPLFENSQVYIEYSHCQFRERNPGNREIDSSSGASEHQDIFFLDFFRFFSIFFLKKLEKNDLIREVHDAKLARVDEHCHRNTCVVSNR
jgi:hypothetical protein